MASSGQYLRSQVIQPIVAGGQNQAAAVQGGLVDFQLQRIQQRLLAHRLHNAAGAQYRQAAFDPQVRVKGALSRSLFAALDAR